MFKMLRSNVLLKPKESHAETRSGLILNTGVANEAEVVATGPEVKEVKTSDLVRFDASSVVKMGEFYMCREADILCVIEE